MDAHDFPLLSQGVVPDDLIEAARDHARELLGTGERISTWSNELVWALASEVMIAREVSR